MDSYRPLYSSTPLALLHGALLGGANGLLALLESALFPGRAPKQPRRIGVLRVGMVGDLAAAWPALAGLRARYPDADLRLLSSAGATGAPGAAELYGSAPELDGLLTWSADELAEPGGRRALLRRVRELRLDLVVALPQEHATPRTLVRDLAFFRAAGVRRARGFRLAGLAGLVPPWIGAGWLGTGGARGMALRAQARARTAEPEHRRLAALAEVASGSARPWTHTAEDLAAAAALVTEFDLERGPLLVLSPGAKLATKRWPAERFGELARRWCEAGGTACVIGAPSEAQLAGAVRAASGERAVSLIGRTGLAQALALLERAALHVTNDSGPMHLAGLVDAPQVALFSGYGEPGAWDPQGSRHALLRSRVRCSGCQLEHCRPAAGTAELACLTGIEVEAVLRAGLGVCRRAPVSLSPWAQLAPAAEPAPPPALPSAAPPREHPGTAAQPRETASPAPAPPLEGRPGDLR